MEFLLNILWLMLTLPAIWLWLQDPASVQSSRRLGSVRPIVLLGCVLVLLFPVVSATDDMHVMRPELEESNSSKRQVEASRGETSHSSQTILHASPALRFRPYSFSPSCLIYGRVVTTPSLRPEPVYPAHRNGRAPPPYPFS
jgi:hypothetical protein